MLRLGTKVRIAGQEGLVIARTLAGTPKYDVRLTGGRLIKYADESDLQVVEGSEVLPPARDTSSAERPPDTPRGD